MLLSTLLIACSSSVPTLDEEPLSAALLVHEESPRRKLWLFRESNGEFKRQTPHIARDISSLGATVHRGELTLTGICWWPGCGSPEEMAKRHELGPLVFGLSTTDLDSWTPLQWRLVDPLHYTPIDPQLRVGESGLELWYFGVPGQAHRDPADRSNHDIRRATLGSDGRFYAEETVIRAPGLADPAPIEFKNNDLLFATQFAAESIVVYRGSPPEQVARFEGVSVPFPMVVDEELWLLATRVINGRPQAVRAISKDGIQFSEFSPFLPLGSEEVCASPVGAQLNGSTVVFCVEEPILPG